MSERKWDSYSACACVEGFDGEEHDEETIKSAWQYLIDAGLCFGPGALQGWYGRTASDLIARGICTAPQRRAAR